MNEKELKSFRRSLLTLNKAEHPIRDLKVADIVYPWIDGIMDDYRVRHEITDSDDYLEFNIKVSNYFNNIYKELEELFDYSTPEDVEEYVWEYLSNEISFFMEENAPDREYFQEGLSEGWLIIEHYFSWSGDDWSKLSEEEKLEHLYYDNITIENLIDELDEVIFWIEFEEKLKQKNKEIEDKEFANCVIEDIKNNFNLLQLNTERE